MNIKWNTVTWYSKLLSIIFFIIILPIWTLYLNTQYQQTKEMMSQITINNKIVFLHRDDDILSLYTINPDSSNKKLIYRNNDKVNSNIIAPRWTDKNTILFGAMKNGNWKIFSIKSDGTDLKLLNDLDMSTSDFAVSRESRDKNLIVEELNDQKEYRLSYIENGVKKKIYSVNYSVGDLIHEVSFSPDRKYVIFEQGKNIMIASVDGKNVRVLTEGESPDWR